MEYIIYNIFIVTALGGFCGSLVGSLILWSLLRGRK